MVQFSMVLQTQFLTSVQDEHRRRYAAKVVGSRKPRYVKESVFYTWPNGCRTYNADVNGLMLHRGTVTETSRPDCNRRESRRSKEARDHGYSRDRYASPTPAGTRGH